MHLYIYLIGCICILGMTLHFIPPGNTNDLICISAPIPGIYNGPIFRPLFSLGSRFLGLRPSTETIYSDSDFFQVGAYHRRSTSPTINICYLFVWFPAKVRPKGCGSRGCFSFYSFSRVIKVKSWTDFLTYFFLYIYICIYFIFLRYSIL